MPKTFDLEKGIEKTENLARALAKTKPVIIIGIAGGSGSGKTHVAGMLLKSVGGKILSMDSYYIGIENMKDRNFDSPDALDLNLLKEHLKLLKQNTK